MITGPVRLKTGDLGCPDCKYALDSVKSPFYLYDEYVGHFDSLSCSICNYHLFTAKGYEMAIKTAKGYEMAIKTAKGYGLINSKMEEEIEDITEERFTICHSSANSNLGSSLLSHENESNLVSQYMQLKEKMMPIPPPPQNMKTQRRYY